MFKTGHWNHSFILTPDNSFGFIYYVENKLNGKKYIGKKQYFSYRAGKKHKESDWKTYTSSSKYLDEDIKINGIDNFYFEIPCYRDWETDRKSTRLNSSHLKLSRMPSSA